MEEEKVLISKNQTRIGELEREKDNHDLHVASLNKSSHIEEGGYDLYSPLLLIAQYFPFRSMSSS